VTVHRIDAFERRRAVAIGYGSKYLSIGLQNCVGVTRRRHLYEALEDMAIAKTSQMDVAPTRIVA
jgi:hypothetical protein